MGRIGDDGDAAAWHREWTATADAVAGAARAAEDGGHAVSAREAYLRAAVYHRTSYQPLYGAPVDPRLIESFERESEALASMVRLAAPALDSSRSRSRAGASRAVRAGGGRRPARGTIVHTNGYDSDLTEMYVAHVAAAVARGYDILLFDGPGQGRNLIRDGIKLRPDWENVVGPVLDWVLEHPGIDPRR